MVPTIKQHLAAIRHTMEKTLIPALDANADFAREQAGLMLASIDWLMDVQGAEVRYARLEYAEWSALLAALVGLASTETTARADINLNANTSSLAALPELQAEILNLKTAAETLFSELAAITDSGTAAKAKQLMSEVCRRQSDREQAWVRVTGFAKPDCPSLDAVLAAQESAHKP